MDNSIKRNSDKCITQRNWWTASFGVCVSFLFFFFWLIWVLSEHESRGEISGPQVLFLSIFFPLVCWFILKASFFTNIKIKDDNIVVNNLLTKHIIPLGKVSRTSWDGGLDIHLKDGRKYWCFNFGGSLLGALSGYPTNRRCARVIDSAVARRKSGVTENNNTDVASVAHFNISFFVSLCFASFLVIFLLNL